MAEHAHAETILSYLKSHNISIATVADALGISRSQLYDYFAGRDGHPLPEQKLQSVVEYLGGKYVPSAIKLPRFPRIK